MMLQRYETDRRLLEEIFTDDEPLGPSQTRADVDFDEFKLIYEDDTQLWRSMKNQPAVVIGRKGAGKTACRARSASSGDRALPKTGAAG